MNRQSYRYYFTITFFGAWDSGKPPFELQEKNMAGYWNMIAEHFTHE